MGFDPDEALEKIRIIVARMRSGDDGGDDAYDLVDEETGSLLHDHPVDVLELSNLVHAMDQWLAGGGRPPKAWDRS